jgi:beta-glucanase (GH16 family)
MASLASSPTYVDPKRLLLLALAAALMHCQVKDSGLAGPFGSGGVPGSGGSTNASTAATGGRGAGGSGGTGDGAFDAQVGVDVGGADANLAVADSGNTNPDGASATGATGGSGTVVASGGAGMDGGAQGDATGSGGRDTRAATGGSQGNGGTTGLGGSPDAEIAAVDSESPDLPVAADVPPGGLDLGIDDAKVADLGTDLPRPPTDVADALRPPVDRVDAVPVDTRPPLTLVWQDEFEGEANAGVDTENWTYVTWAAGHINNEKQRYTTSRQNVFLDGNGHLVIRALGSGTQYTSGRIETNGPGQFSFKFGRIEVKAKLPAGQGSFPGIVMMGTSGSWPQCGEIALMEQYGGQQDKSWYYASAYADNSAGSGDKRNIRYEFPDATTASTDFHIYSLDWYTDHLVFQVDGIEVMRTSFGTNSPFYTTPEYIVLDVALGGDMGGTIDPNAFEAGMMDMVVDYVKVYSF